MRYPISKTLQLRPLVGTPRKYLPSSGQLVIQLEVVLRDHFCTETLKTFVTYFLLGRIVSKFVELSLVEGVELSLHSHLQTGPPPFS
ncbi:hypothetical protein EG68_06394 [Paragonimus skrjabini miyazakii]|uniref:Uncharacterized protein n=1 Tax=Paragonimus skrjabini miyazakii TaxID=59628 RepID=A0A8S9YT62_9TREM|nr:hypothetical protein EG68_06394 [Paragonimus skrjabini miyazakii]